MAKCIWGFSSCLVFTLWQGQATREPINVPQLQLLRLQPSPPSALQQFCCPDMGTRSKTSGNSKCLAGSGWEHIFSKSRTVLGTLQGTDVTTMDRPHATKGGPDYDKAGGCWYWAAEAALFFPSPVSTQTKKQGQVYIHMVQWCYWIFSKLQNLDLTQNQLKTGLSMQ